MMIFGHAPIIFPAVLQRPMRFRAIFYGHLVLLHVSLLVRVVGDLASSPELRVWGGVANAAAIVWFLDNTVTAMLTARRDGPVS